MERPIPVRKHPEFMNDMETKRFHFFNKKLNRLPGYYPKPFPNLEDISPEEIQPEDHREVRAFFKLGKKLSAPIEEGILSVVVDSIEDDRISAEIMTRLPKQFPFQQGDTILLSVDEILY